MVTLELDGLDLTAGRVEDRAVHSQRLVGFVSAAQLTESGVRVDGQVGNGVEQV
jgi:hypothetical protein